MICKSNRDSFPGRGNLFDTIQSVHIYSVTPPALIQCLAQALPPGIKRSRHENDLEFHLMPWLTLNLLTTTIVAPPSNASKWQMGFNSAFKGLRMSGVTPPLPQYKLVAHSYIFVCRTAILLLLFGVAA